MDRGQIPERELEENYFARSIQARPSDLNW